MIEDYTRDHIRDLLDRADKMRITGVGTNEAAVEYLIEAVRALLDAIPVRYPED